MLKKGGKEQAARKDCLFACEKSDVLRMLFPQKREITKNSEK